LQVVVVVLNGIHPQGEVDPQVEGFGRPEGFVFGEGRGIFEVGAKADTGIGEESAVHLLGNELLLLVGRGKGLTDDAGIAEQVGVDADEFGFGHPAEEGGEVDGGIDAQALVASEKREGGVGAVGLFHGFGGTVAIESAQVESAIDLEGVDGATANQIEHAIISVEGLL